MDLDIIPGATADAGDDDIICEDESYTVTGASASSNSTILWTTTGNGVLTGETTLTPLEKELIGAIRRMTWMELDDLTDTVIGIIPNANRSNVYRTLKSFDINRVPQEQKEKAKKFKEYEPGYLHIDVTYLPKFDGQKYYLFVAIDRATRVLYYKVYKNKSSQNAVEFLKECKEFFPFYLTHILTDNGLEFTDKWARGKGKVSGNHKFDVECKEDKIEHRLTAPYTPQTNGMVERVNGTIKNATIKAQDYENIEDVKKDLNKFLIYYNVNRRHGSLSVQFHHVMVA
jgi:transposase-like protein